MNLDGDAPDWLKKEEIDLDLGDDHWLKFVTDADHKERDGTARHIGAVVYHRCSKTESGWDSGFIQFDLGAESYMPGDQKWQVASWDPLTLTPSLLQRGCGDHGFVTAGKWVRA